MLLSHLSKCFALLSGMKRLERLYGVWLKIVTVRGNDVPFTLEEIWVFYDATLYEIEFLENTDLTFEVMDMESIIKYLTENRGEWNLLQDTGLPTNFNQAIMFPIAKMWMPFICTKITPTLNVSSYFVVWNSTGKKDMHWRKDTPKRYALENAYTKQRDDDYEAAFQPRYPMQNGPIIQSLGPMEGNNGEGEIAPSDDSDDD
ncbi:hypothetical protein Golob_022907 [Gossypium lobatum]|uniref:Uncharacterized protein n=1 Tax=Gossypium lobatum TaxID=34289 RepID=A0A7J8LHX9_9ROSI|nr:hypothetical protein [Gossypium lobatum]